LRFRRAGPGASNPGIPSAESIVYSDRYDQKISVVSEREWPTLQLLEFAKGVDRVHVRYPLWLQTAQQRPDAKVFATLFAVESW
jgi:hypothetical protein